MSADMDERLRQLGIYNDYYYRLELKPLGQMLQVDEHLGCVLTGVMEGRRKMLAITDSRLIIIGAGIAVQTDVIVIKRNSLKEWKFTKRFLFSSVLIRTDDGGTYVFHNVQAGREKLFNEAMSSPIREYDK